MKTIARISLLALLSLPALGLFSQKPVPVSNKPVANLLFDIGKPAWDCEGFGVCKIRLLVAKATNQPVTARTARSTATVQGHSLKVSYPASGMDKKTFGFFDVSTEIEIPEDIPLPTEVAQALGLKKATLLAGKYPLRKRPANSDIGSFFDITYRID